MRDFLYILQLLSVAYHFFSTSCYAFHGLSRTFSRSSAVDNKCILNLPNEGYGDKIRYLPSGRLLFTSLFMSDDDSDDDDKDAESNKKENKEENMAEFLMAQAERELKEKKDKEAFDAQVKKKLISKKRSDREYEEYWEKQKKGGGKEEQVNDAAVYRAYYSLRKNETLNQKIGERLDHIHNLFEHMNPILPFLYTSMFTFVRKF